MKLFIFLLLNGLWFVLTTTNTNEISTSYKITNIGKRKPPSSLKPNGTVTLRAEIQKSYLSTRLKYKNRFKRHEVTEFTTMVAEKELMPEMEDSSNALTIKMLIYGRDKQLRSVPREAIFRSLWAIQKIELPVTKKLVIWDILKGNRPVNSLKRSFFESAGNLLLSIPQSDLFNINVSDWQIVDFFGSLPGLSRRQAGILGFALRRTHGNDIIQNSEMINRIKGLICGFSLHDLSTISDREFTQIGGDVFDNIGACTFEQKKVLLETAMRVSVYGPPQVWNDRHIKRLGLLITAMDKDILSRIQPQAIKGINADTLRATHPEQLRRFTKTQVGYMSDSTLTQYRKMMGLPSDTKQIKIISTILVVFVSICLLCF